MAKRIAGSDLNHDNWDQEEETEEAGTFKRAPPEELQKRVIKTAKRRLPERKEGEQSSIFAGFAGFGAAATTAKPAASTFSFLTQSSTTVTPAPPTNGQTSKPPPSMDKPDAAPALSATKPTLTPAEKYTSDLKALNLGFSKWIQSCLEKNSVCILTPLFDDYQRYLKEIEEEKKRGEATAAAATTTTTAIKVAPPQEIKKPEPVVTAAAPPKTDPAPAFSFTASATASSTVIQTPTQPTKPLFSFGTASTTTPFSFGTSGSSSGATSTPFTFGNVKPPVAAAEEKKDDEDEDDEPPKPDFKPVVEEDAVYSKRCKMFVKVDKNFSDRGIGTLFLKQVDDGKKTQLLVRADTALGNILLNTLLSGEMPMQRTGKNNVLIVCCLDGKPPPSTVLLRVKTGEEADELLETLQKHKQ